MLCQPYAFAISFTNSAKLCASLIAMKRSTTARTSDSLMSMYCRSMPLRSITSHELSGLTRNLMRTPLQDLP